MLDDFIDLSERLTGVAPLDSALAAEYLARCQSHPIVGPKLADLIAAARKSAKDDDAGLKRDVIDDGGLRPIAQQLIYLWYVGAFFDLDSSDTTGMRGTWHYGDNPDHYGRGLIWPVVRAHAPMTPPAAERWTDPVDPNRPVTVPASGWIDQK